MNKPKLSIKISSIEDPTIFKIFTKSNGLKNVAIDGISGESPYYGIISKSGTVEIVDSDGWIKQQSDNNILPEIKIDLYVDKILHLSFISDNDIVYDKLTKKVTINLVDRITSLQNVKTKYGVLFENTTAYTIFLNICQQIGISCIMNEDTKEFLLNLKTKRLYVDINTGWNILQQFAYGSRCILYKKADVYYIKRVNE